MLHEITTMQDVRAFLEQITDEIDNFHPLQDFADYTITGTHMQRYTEDEAAERNMYLEECFNVCAKHTPDFFTYLLRLAEDISDPLNKQAKAHAGANSNNPYTYQLSSSCRILTGNK